ncbi:D-isomer specific 2-hydroxyacid dehydrogenase [Xylaria bambusicola]|uniref:D-isomer specific 2-hydroxyacid dehydrogenase n=1 Tax=Xylaria bambusicola TaxID=326684 RepID=UPI0020081E7E|nr:D-isomer specific 2-hydroxyacid dehydrogenase [Xylaria bambusicola]KAI0517062.1 D-isomer specific 2-hydroxyacid dehydrogenase [Xylaria bambusicola]
MAPTVLRIGNLSDAMQEWKALGSKYTLLEFPSGTREEFLANCRDGVYDSVVACYRSNGSTRYTGRFDAELVDALPKSWKYVAHNGAGYDTVDVDACSRRQIAVSNTPVAVDDATADVGVFLMLGALRMAHFSITALRAGKWMGDTPRGHDPKGKTLGILGMGGIGRAFAHRARAFGMRIIYHNRRRLDPALEQDAEYVSFDDLLARSDVLSLNLALNPSTRHIIGAPELARTKPGVVIVNTARGALIDEAALVEALDSGHVSAVGLDVYEHEPEIHPGLVKNERAFLLPHVGTYTVETAREMELLVLKNLQAAVDEGKMLTLVSEQKDLEWAPATKAFDA